MLKKHGTKKNMLVTLWTLVITWLPDATTTLPDAQQNFVWKS